MINLPQPIAEYFAAGNENDPDRIAVCFAPDARVVDERHDHVGREAIRAWAAEARRKYSYTAEPTAIEGPVASPVVTARVAGNFPGSPIDLRYRFTLANGAIVALEIV